MLNYQVKIGIVAMRRNATDRPKGTFLTWSSAGRVVADEIPADDESLGQSVRRGLFGIRETDAEVGPIPEEPLETGQVVRRGDDEDVPDPGHHQDGDGIVYHGLVVDGEKLLGHSLRNGIEARSAASGEDDSFHNG